MLDILMLLVACAVSFVVGGVLGRQALRDDLAKEAVAPKMPTPPMAGRPKPKRKSKKRS